MLHPTLLRTYAYRGAHLVPVLLPVDRVRHRVTVAAIHRVAAGLRTAAEPIGQDHTQKKQGPHPVAAEVRTCTAPDLRYQNRRAASAQCDTGSA